MKTFLIQGDSITDADRNRSDDTKRGNGYANIVASEIMCDYPGQFNIINRGKKGDRSVDLYARIKSDIINLEPDYLSILIGVNDAWHEFAGHDGVSNDKFFRIYSLLIEEIKEACPSTEIFILEPFALNGSALDDYDSNLFLSKVEYRAMSAKMIAEKYGLHFVELQKKFDEASLRYSSEYWLYDGIHPTAAGHQIIARELSKAFRTVVDNNG